MTLKQLEYFLEIARLGSVTRAAQSLNISQPPLSLQLKALEDELDTRLFQRDNRRMEITPEGRFLQERVQAILALLSETTDDLHAMSTERQLTLRIATIGSINNRLLPEVISRFSQNYPYVSFRVIEGRSDDILEHLADGTADFGFVREPFNMTNLRSVPIRDPALGPEQTDYFVAIAQAQFYDHYQDDPNSLVISLDELQGKPLVIHQRYREMLLGACRKRGFSPHIICENGEIQSSLSWARAGIGIAIAPFTSACMNTNPNLIIRKLDSLPFSPRVCLVWNQDRRLSSEALAFVNMI